MFYNWHEPQFQQLEERLARVGELPHALLLVGQVGIGKRAFGRAIAQGMLCEANGTGLLACKTCQACHWMASESHPDFRLLAPEREDAAEDSEPTEKRKKTDISVAQIRSLTDFINISAHRKGTKVVLIQPAEAMNVSAANALLKNLEEPTPGTQFILVSDRPHMLPATIRSRCQRLVLPPPSTEQAVAWLKQNSATQPELALAVAGGAPLAALELDQTDYWAQRQQFLTSLTARSYDALALAERYASTPIPQIINWLQRWTYDISRMCSGQLVRYNVDQLDALGIVKNRVKPIEILRFHRDLVRFQRIVNHPLNPRLLLEDLFARYGQLVQG
jgi:DNA polymerase-3 subunit delta'